MNVEILLLGIHLPPNYGRFYTQQFHQTYVELAEKYSLPFVPFLLEGVATNPDLMQADGIHPKAKAQPQILDNVWPYLKNMIPPRKLRWLFIYCWRFLFIVLSLKQVGAAADQAIDE